MRDKCDDDVLAPVTFEGAIDATADIGGETKPRLRESDKGLCGTRGARRVSAPARASYLVPASSRDVLSGL